MGVRKESKNEKRFYVRQREKVLMVLKRNLNIFRQRKPFIFDFIG